MPKRGENIRRRKDGRWEGRYKNKEGKYTSVYGKSYHEVKDKLRTVLTENVEAATGVESSSAPAVSFQEVCEEWLSSKQLKIKASTYSAYYTVLFNHLTPFWAGKGIHEIDFSEEVPKLIQQKLAEGFSTNRIQEILQRLKQVLKFAQRHYGIHNPELEVDFQPYMGKEIMVLTEHEQKALTNLLLLQEDTKSLGVFLSLYMGLRIGEVCALQWSDIDFDAGTLTISKTLQRVKNFEEGSMSKTKIVIGTPKSVKSRRCLPIPKFLLQQFRSYKCAGKAYLLTGTPIFIEPRQYENIFKSYLQTAHIRPVNYHSLRHTFATRAIEKGIDIKTLSEILGHSTITITLQTYVHSSMKNKKLCMEKIAG